MSGFFGGGSQPTSVPEYTGLQIQTAVNTLPIPIVWGMSKLAPNIVWYNNFQAIPQGGGGGKGGNSPPSGYDYTADIIMALCEGGIAGVNRIWRGQSTYTLQTLGINPQEAASTFGKEGVSSGGVVLFQGTTPQTMWGYLEASDPSEALAYQGTAYVAGAGYYLGDSATLDNHNFEIEGFFLNTGYGPGYAAGGDADPTRCLNDFLTNAQYGVGFPSASIDTTSLFTQGGGNDASVQTYCRAVGLALSPALTDQEQASSILARWLQLINVAAVWSGGLLRFIPYGDYPVTGNGITFSPAATPIYDLADDDYVHADNEDPLQVTRSDPYVAYNVWRLEAADRNNAYNLTSVESRDQNAIELYGMRIAPTVTAHEICDVNIALISGQLMLQRSVYIRNTFKFRLSWEYCLLDPMDLVTVTDVLLGLLKAPIRITEVEEDENGLLQITAEEFPQGAQTATLYATQSAINNPLNRNVGVGSVNAPIVFEPTDELGGGLQIWAAVSSDNPLYGGCNVWMSTSEDGDYALIGTAAPALIGVTSADLPPVTINVSGQTIDQVNTLAVDLTQSNGELPPGSQNAALSLIDACYVGGEIASYGSATLTAANKYNLSYLVRGAYGTESDIIDHPAGTPFAFLNNAIFKYAFNQSYIGSTVYLKFQSFNVFGGGAQSLADCVAYAYMIEGSALASPLPDVSNLYTNFEAGFQKIYWDEVSDFRNGIVYEIRQGASWSTAQLICTQAHPPFIARGNGTFWMSARCQPVAGLTVYSETPASITIAGNQLSANLLAAWDEKATNWQGTFDNGIGIAGPPFGGGSADVRLGGSANILAESILLASTTTSAATAAGNNVLTVASVANVSVGQAVNDLTHPTVIPGGTTVQSTNVTALTVTLTNAVTGAGVSNGDTIVFGDPDVLSSGGITTDTPLYYTIPESHIVKSGSITNASVNASTQIVGVPAGQNMLGVTNILTYPDILGSASTAYVDGWIEISVSQDGGTTWSAWQKFVPGVYPGNTWNFRLVLESEAANIIPFATAFNFQVQLPSRIDHYQNQSVPSSGLTINFTPDGSTTPQTFNGGPGSNDLPYVSVSWQATAGDTYVISGLSLSQMTITFYNTGVAVARTGVNIDVEGY